MLLHYIFYYHKAAKELDILVNSHLTFIEKIHHIKRHGKALSIIINK